MNIIDAIYMLRQPIQEGGPTSGNWNHKGRKGQVGGSQPGGGNAAVMRLIDDPTRCAYIDKNGNYGAIPEGGEELADRATLIRALSMHDEAVIDQVRGLYIYATPEQLIAAAQSTGSRSAQDLLPDDIGGFTHEKSMTVHVQNPGYLPDIAEGNLHHELGHIAYSAMSYSPGQTSWDAKYRQKTFDRETGYARNGGPKEAYADSYHAYVEGRFKGKVEWGDFEWGSKRTQATMDVIEKLRPKIGKTDWHDAGTPLPKKWDWPQAPEQWKQYELKTWTRPNLGGKTTWTASSTSAPSVAPAPKGRAATTRTRKTKEAAAIDAGAFSHAKTGKPYDGAIPETLAMPESTTHGDIIITKTVVYRQGDAGYADAAARWLYWKGFVPSAQIQEGGPGSGNWHHAGRKGQVGGSQPGGGLRGMPMDRITIFQKAKAKIQAAFGDEPQPEGAASVISHKAAIARTSGWGSKPLVTGQGETGNFPGVQTCEAIEGGHLWDGIENSFIVDARGVMTGMKAGTEKYTINDPRSVGTMAGGTRMHNHPPIPTAYDGFSPQDMVAMTVTDAARARMIQISKDGVPQLHQVEPDKGFYKLSQQAKADILENYRARVEKAQQDGYLAMRYGATDGKSGESYAIDHQRTTLPEALRNTDSYARQKYGVALNYTVREPSYLQKAFEAGGGAERVFQQMGQNRDWLRSDAAERVAMRIQSPSPQTIALMTQMPRGPKASSPTPTRTKRRTARAGA